MLNAGWKVSKKWVMGSLITNWWGFWENVHNCNNAVMYSGITDPL